MGNYLAAFFVFGKTESTGDTNAGSGAGSGDSGVKDDPSKPPTQNWCYNTWDHGLRTGDAWTTTRCEEEMEKDVTDVLANIDTYLVDLEKDIFPNDENRLKDDLMLNNFNNRSHMDDPRGNGDDGLWTIELQKRVAARFTGGYPISADEKKILNKNLKRMSKLSRRTSFDTFRGISRETEYGELSSVFDFTGKA